MSIKCIMNLDTLSFNLWFGMPTEEDTKGIKERVGVSTEDEQVKGSVLFSESLEIELGIKGNN